MAKSKQTAICAAESVPDSFDALQGRFLSLTSRLEVLSQALYNTDNEPSGGLRPPPSFCETLHDMIQLQEDIEGWAAASTDPMRANSGKERWGW